MRIFLQWVLILVFGFPAVVQAANPPPTLPDWLSLMPGLQARPDIVDERYGEAQIPIPQNPKNLVRGRHWEAGFKMPASVAKGGAIWAQWKPVLQQSGWAVIEERDRNPLSVTLKLTKGREAWVNIIFFAADDIRMDLVEVSENRWHLTLPSPGSKPEELKEDHRNIPFLLPPPGAKFSGASIHDKPMSVTLRDKEGHSETRVQVASGSVSKYYRTPKDLSNLDFALAYRDALQAAGWKVLRFSQSVNSSDTLLVAHYGESGRNLWAVLRHAPGEVSFEIGEEGRVDMAQRLKKDCRIVLLGVLFDFDKATLQPASNAVLSKAREAIVASPGLALEVGGHTDSVGDEAYNQKLSEARAQSVMNWLVSKGVSKGQLVARGYGKTRPVASNDTDEGRASNRRVELTCRK